MRRTDYQHLRVYRLAEKLADEAWKVVTPLSTFEKQTLGSQLVRAADSVGANIAEGVGRGSFLDNKRCVRIARGSLYEAKHWLRLAYKRKMMTAESTQEIAAVVDELTPVLNAYLKSIKPKPEIKSKSI